MVDFYRDEEPKPWSGLEPAKPRDNKPADDFYPSMSPENRQKESWELLNTTPDKLTTAQILYPKMLQENLEEKKAHQTSIQPTPFHSDGARERGRVGNENYVLAEYSDKPHTSRMIGPTLDSVEDNYRNLAKIGRAFGWKHAAESLQHYLDGAGVEKVLTRDEARELRTLRTAEEENFGQHIQKTLEGYGAGNVLRNLGDGEEKTFEVGWKTELGYPDILVGGPNAVLTHGRATLESPGTFFAKRQGDIIELRGIIDQSLADEYDYHKGKFLADGALMLEREEEQSGFR